MKLTKDRFSNGAFSKDKFVYSITVTEEEKQEILENQTVCEAINLHSVRELIELKEKAKIHDEWLKLEDKDNIIKELQAKAARYDEMCDRYLHGSDKYFNEITSLYFEDEPIKVKS